jgi:TRAP-type C4-dicarboxylate transport system permease large subunit
MLLFTAGLLAGASVGSIVMAFLSIAAYQRGYAEATQRRDAWRSELRARRHLGAAARTAA